MSFLSKRTQMTYLNGSLSSERPINKGVVQRSGIGPTLFIVIASNFHTVSKVNKIFKYADDVTLIKPKISAVDLAEQFSHICHWSHDNKMIINLQKTKEIVFHKPNPRVLLNAHTVQCYQPSSICQITWSHLKL